MLPADQPDLWSAAFHHPCPAAGRNPAYLGMEGTRKGREQCPSQGASLGVRLWSQRDEAPDATVTFSS